MAFVGLRIGCFVEMTFVWIYGGDVSRFWSGFPATSAPRPELRHQNCSGCFARRGKSIPLSLGLFLFFSLDLKNQKRMLGCSGTRRRVNATQTPPKTIIKVRRKSEKFVASFCYFLLHNAMFRLCCEAVLWGNKPDVGRGYSRVSAAYRVAHAQRHNNATPA
jgi:hypothetical protein